VTVRERFSAYVPSAGARPVARVVQSSGGRPVGDRDPWVPTALSLLLHVGAAALLILQPHGPTRGELEENAPAFAIQFQDLPQTPQTQPSPPQPQVRFGDEEESQPPIRQEQEPSPESEPMPPLHFGSALRPHTSGNPFAHVVPFDLSQSQPRSPTALPPGSRGLDLSAGPVVRNGRLVESVTHVRGRHGYDDYLEALYEFVRARGYYPRQAAENGEEGLAQLEITINRDGSVKRIRWLQHSGSALIDAAWLSVFEHRLPPLNDDIPGDELTFPFAGDYTLIYGGGGR